MFSCNACFRRAITSLISDVPPETFTRKSLLLLPPRTQFIRHHSTVESIQKGHHRRVLEKALNSKQELRPNKHRHPRRGATKVDRRDAKARERNRFRDDFHQPAVYGDGAGDGAVDEGGSAGSTTFHKRSDEEYQLQFLTDPLKLASAVLARLRVSDVQGALSLVRASDKEQGENNIVSWNHVMDYEMNFKNVRGALKVYNEMKKRGHKPDAHTYTIMLRGFTHNIQAPQAIQNALTVYNSMSAPNSAVTPNVIHTNAIINACARGRDMDALWSVAGKLPERGPGAPDKWTFTTILNALNAHAVKAASDLVSEGRRNREDVEEAEKRVLDDAVSDGRKLWEDITGKWKSGDIMVDQSLVCAMGRLLLLGSQPRHWNDVFALVEQTMNIPRLRSGGGENLKALEATETDATKSFADPTTNEFAPVSIAAASSNKGRSMIGATATSVYALPGNNALQMLMQAAVMTKNVAAGKMYWDLLTDVEGPYKLQPDAANLGQYLRLLRISRSSKTIVELLTKQDMSRGMERDFFKRGTFVLAMSTCVRDKNNPNVFEHASTVLDVMQQKLGDQDGLDPRVMEMYVSLAVVTTPGVSHVAPLRDMDFETNSRKNNTMRALARVAPSVEGLKDLMMKKVQEAEFGEDSLPESVKRNLRTEAGKRTESQAGGVDALAGFLSTLVGAYDRLLARGVGKLEKGYFEDCMSQKRRLSAFVTKMVGGVRPGTHDGAGGQEAKRIARAERRPRTRVDEDGEDEEVDDALTEFVGSSGASRNGARGRDSARGGRGRDFVRGTYMGRRSGGGKEFGQGTRNEWGSPANSRPSYANRRGGRVNDDGDDDDNIRNHFPPKVAAANQQRKELQEFHAKGPGSSMVLPGWGASFAKGERRDGSAGAGAGGGGGRSHDFVV